MLFHRSGYRFLFMLMMIALAFLSGGMKAHVEPVKNAAGAVQTSGTIASRPQVRVEGELLTFVVDSPTDRLMKKHAVTSRTLAAGVLEKVVLADPATYLELRPRITIGDGMDGRFNVMRNQSGPTAKVGLEMVFQPKEQPDGRIRMDATVTCYEPGNKVVKLVDRNRIYRADEDGSQVIGPIRRGGRNMYCCIRVEMAAERKQHADQKR